MRTVEKSFGAVQTLTIIFLYFQASQLILQKHIPNGVITKEGKREERLNVALRKMVLNGFPRKMRTDGKATVLL